MHQPYAYVGPEEIRQKTVGETGRRIRSPEELESWLRETNQECGGDGLIRVTFVVDLEGCLRVADRHSEHVACAGGARVLSAGEIAFESEPGGIEVVEISNQSTGYCPEPESWPAVRAALERIPLRHPDGFTLEVIFRRCGACGRRNIVKDAWFTCGDCGADLPLAWNFARG